MQMLKNAAEVKSSRVGREKVIRRVKQTGIAITKLMFFMYLLKLNHIKAHGIWILKKKLNPYHVSHAPITKYKMYSLYFVKKNQS